MSLQTSVIYSIKRFKLFDHTGTHLGEGKGAVSSTAIYKLYILRVWISRTDA